MNHRVWLITGASSGFGRALADSALAAGDTVVAAVRDPTMVADLAEAHPDRAFAVELDITDQSRITGAVTEVLEHHSRVDVLVNNAGRGIVGAAEETTDSEFRDLMDLHLFGPAALTRAVLPHMRAQGSGSIVQMSSQAGRFSFPGVSAYSATKFALEGWSEALAAEVEPLGIHVLIVEPGAFRTAFNAPGVLLFSESGEAYEQQVGCVREALTAVDGQQPGDPAKAADAIVTALGAPKIPLRLALGNDAAETISAGFERARAEFIEWESVTRGTDF